MGNIVGRMARPGSELATQAWLQQRSALGELIDFDFEAINLNRLYRVSDALYKHREALQDHLFGQAQKRSPSQYATAPICSVQMLLRQTCAVSR